MKAPIAVTVLTAAVVGAASGVLTNALFSPGAGPDRSARAAQAPVLGPTSAEEAPDLSTAVAMLSDENQDLRERIAALEERASAAVARIPVAGSPEAAAQSGELREQLASFMRDDGDLPPAFVASVGEALDSIRSEENRLREDERLRLQAERIDERLDRLSEQLGLSNYQEDEMRVALNDYETARYRLRESMAEGGDWGTMRESMRTIRDEQHETLGTILTPEQLSSYEDTERRDWRGPGIDRRPPGDGQGGQGGFQRPEGNRRGR